MKRVSSWSTRSLCFFDNVDNLNTINWQNDSITLQDRIPQKHRELDVLIKNLDLIDIQVVYLEDDSNRLGIAYEFDCNGDKTIGNHHHFMVFALDPEDKEGFGAYEQFTGYYGRAEDFAENWIYSKNEN